MEIPNPGGDALSCIKADRAMISALRETQADHDGKLSKLLEGQARLEAGQKTLIDGQVLLEDRIINQGMVQIRTEMEVTSLKAGQLLLGKDVTTLKTDVAELKVGQVRLEGRFDRLEGRFDRLEGRFDQLEGRFDQLEALVRKGFGMDSEN